MGKSIGKERQSAILPSRGLTLLEVTVGLALLCIFAGIALLGLRPFLARARVHTAARQIASDLQFARTKAIAQNRRFRITFRADTQDYIVERNENGMWQRHLLHSHSTAEAAEATVPFPPGVRLTSVNSGSDVIFLPRGSVDGGITITLGATTVEETQQVIVNLAGRVRIE
jgi:prepilin-type N-terminal cleavage/methylation domain-containing protein